MSIVKDPSKVKDEEITLEDVRRAEEIINRANKLLGTSKDGCHHYHWNYVRPYVNVPYTPSWNSVSLLTSSNSTTTTKANPLTVNCSIVEAANFVANK